MVMENAISDASDFAHTPIPKLTQLDALLRCHICKDFLKVPVLTPCGHTFCSLCIREYINVQGKCPLCLSELRDSMLRSEFLVSEIVDSYKAVRDDLVRVLVETKKQQEEEDADQSVIDLGSDVEEPGLSQSSDDVQIVGTNERGTLKRAATDLLGGSSRSKFFKSGNVAKRSSTTSRIESMFHKSEEMAACPICERFFPVKELERTHLDECLTLQSLGKSPNPAQRKPKLREKPVLPRSTRIKSTSEAPKVSHVDKYIHSSAANGHQRLPKLDLSSMPVTQVKQKLAQLGLSTLGSKQDMVARYNHYEMLWNSNFCDSLDPVDESELKRQLTSWEASRKSNSTKSTSNSISNMMVSRASKSNSQEEYRKLLANFRNDKFSRKAWSKLFNKQFKRLVRDAKKRVVKSEASTKKATSQHESDDKEDVEDPLSDPDLSADLLNAIDAKASKPSP